MIAGNVALRCNADRRCIRRRANYRPMPVFYFHIRVDGQLFEDPDGSNLPHLGAARAEALAAVREAVVEQIKTGKAVGGQSFEITDGAGRVLETVTYRDVLRLH